VRLVLTGDAHHYAHFIERGNQPDVIVHYLTSGEGGAFLHPTHWLRDTSVEVEWKAAPPLTQIPSLVSLNGFGVHRNEAFSSLRIADYKGFLRLKIDPQGNVTVYPIVVEHVPQTDDGPLLPRLVEKPIKVHAIP
jgi:hypothetical protein